MGAARSRSLDTGSLLIGRSPVCDWVLPDPDRVVSGRHCRIDGEIDRFVLTDLSTNGTFLGDASDPIGFGAKVELQDKQVLRLGDACVVIELTGASPATAPHTIPGSLVADDWFAAPASMAGGSRLEEEFDELFARELVDPSRQVEPAVGLAAGGASLAHLCDGLSGRAVLAALEDVTADWESGTADRLKRQLAARLQQMLSTAPLSDDREVGGA